MDNRLNSPPKKINIWLPLLLSLTMVGGMLIGIKMQNNPPTVAAIAMPKKSDLPPSTLGQGKLEELIRYVEAKYVDDIDKEEMVQEAIDNILFQLDPHSNYISAEELRDVNNQLEGSFDGIGIEFIVVDDTVMVVSAIAGGPAAGAGILPGDKIVQIGDSLCVGENIDYEDVLDKLKGEKGTKVDVGIVRGFEKGVRHFQLTREKIPVNSVEAAYMLDKETGFIKLNRFTAKTYEEFMKALETLVDKHQMKHLVLDLRQNPGGYLQEATNILSQLFEEKDRLLVYTEGNSVPRSEYKSTGMNFYKIENLAVLADEGSASASEIIAGAIQDWDRGVIIGRRTFGKGLVQEQYRLRDGSAIRLTVARYHVPSGRCIQKPYEGRDGYDDDMSERMETGELYDETKIEVQDTTQYFTKGGRVVYGGGGIIPDVFVPLDSVLLDPYYIKMNKHVAAFVFRHLERHRGDFDKISVEDFNKNFSVKEDMMQQFYDFAVRQGERQNDRRWRLVKNEVKRHLKASIARNLWGDKGYYLVINQDDAAVNKALKLVKNDTPLSLK